MLNHLEQMEQFAHENNISLFIDSLPKEMSGFYYRNVKYGIRSITLSNNLDTTAEKICILAEELEHFISTPEDLFVASHSVREKYEKMARFCAVKRLMPFEKLINAKLLSINNSFELADYLNITVDFLQAGIKAYKDHFGLSVPYKDFIIYFDPFDIEKAR